MNFIKNIILKFILKQFVSSQSKIKKGRLWVWDEACPHLVNNVNRYMYNILRDERSIWWRVMVLQREVLGLIFTIPVCAGVKFISRPPEYYRRIIILFLLAFAATLLPLPPSSNFPGDPKLSFVKFTCLESKISLLVCSTNITLTSYSCFSFYFFLVLLSKLNIWSDLLIGPSQSLLAIIKKNRQSLMIRVINI